MDWSNQRVVTEIDMVFSMPDYMSMLQVLTKNTICYEFSVASMQLPVAQYMYYQKPSVLKEIQTTLTGSYSTKFLLGTNNARLNVALTTAKT